VELIGEDNTVERIERNVDGLFNQIFQPNKAGRPHQASCTMSPAEQLPGD